VVIGWAVLPAGGQPVPPPAPPGAPEGPVVGPLAFTSPEGKSGWKVVLPGNRPVATPAIAAGRVFLGGGFGSHEFYAFDARTGEKLWLYRTGDDGPSAAVVDGRYIAFNTESCELEIITMDGRPLWKKWLGDPLMSMPAIHEGKVYMAYPDTKGDNRHRLACFDLATGTEQWKQIIESEAITTPVIVGDHVYLASLDGTLSCFETRRGHLAWKEQKNATSSPVVWNGKCYFSRRQEVASADGRRSTVVQQTEQLASRDIALAGTVTDLLETARTADYLDVAKRAEYSPLEKKFQGLDASVGFGGGLGGFAAPAKIAGESAPMMAKAAAPGFTPTSGTVASAGKSAGVYSNVQNYYNPAGAPPAPTNGVSNTLSLTYPSGPPAGPFTAPAMPPGGPAFAPGAGNTGQMSVAGVWSYQGSRPFVYNGRLYAAMGDTLKCIDLKLHRVLWRKHLSGSPDQVQVDAVLTPPAIVNGKVFVGSAHGVLYCLDADAGRILWKATVGEPIQFQPAVVGGRVYVPTILGSLYCLETGDRRDDGWNMWGANAAHNGLTQQE
jgi:outer membrane protein assembly factor BamB